MLIEQPWGLNLKALHEDETQNKEETHVGLTDNVIDSRVRDMETFSQLSQIADNWALRLRRGLTVSRTLACRQTDFARALSPASSGSAGQ